MEWRPGSSGGMPITPRKGASATLDAAIGDPVAILEPPVDPRRPLRERDTPGAGHDASTPTTSEPPAFAPRTSTGPTSAWPASSSSSNGSKRTPCSYSQRAFGHEKAIVSPGSSDTIGGSSRE